MSLFKASQILILFMALYACSNPVATEPAHSEVYKLVSSKCPNELSFPAENVVWFCDSINEKSIERLLPYLNGKTILVIDSLGGVTADAILLSETLKTTHTTVLVNKLCFSACAQFALLGAPRVFFRSDSILAMHDTQRSTNLIIGSPISDARQDEEKMERMFYESNAVPEYWLVKPTEMLSLSCIHNRESYFLSGQMSVSSKHDFYMPNAEAFRDFYPGRLGNNYPNLKRVKNSYAAMTLSKRFSINFGDSTQQATLSALPNCS